MEDLCYYGLLIRLDRWRWDGKPVWWVSHFLHYLTGSIEIHLPWDGLPSLLNNETLTSRDEFELLGIKFRVLFFQVDLQLWTQILEFEVKHLVEIEQLQKITREGEDQLLPQISQLIGGEEGVEFEFMHVLGVKVLGIGFFKTVEESAKKYRR